MLKLNFLDHWRNFKKLCLYGTNFRYGKAHVRILEKSCPTENILRVKSLDLQVALRDMTIAPIHFALISEAGSSDNIA